MDKHNIRENPCSASEHTDTDTHCFHLILFTDANDMHDLWLPSLPEGFFRFSDNPKHRFLSIMSKNGQWFAACKKPAFFQNVPLDQSFEIALADGQLLQIEFEDSVYSLYAEQVVKEQMIYRNYSVHSNVEISIGSQPDNDICYNSPYVSRKHALLCCSHGQWNIQDCGSTNGVYVNGVKSDSAVLKTGDMICIMGLRMIVGPACLSIQDGTGRVTISRRILQESPPLLGHSLRYYEQDAVESMELYFNRLPRKRIENTPKTIIVEGPPMSMDQKQTPLMLRMGSSMVMGGAAALAGNFITLISSVMFPFLSSKYTDKQRQEYEQLRLSKYKEYLRSKRDEIASACQEEKVFLNQKYPAIHNVIDIVKQKVHLWERRPADNDFLQVRLGTGTRPLSAIIEYPVRRFELESDNLEEEMYKLVESPRYIDDAPIVLPIADTRVCGLLGAQDQIIEFIRQLVLQISAFHSYDEVKIAFYLNSEDLMCLDEIRYLPHVWDNQRTIRFIATNEAEAYKLGEYIKNQLSEDRADEADLRKILKKRPYYLIFALDKKLFEGHESMKNILQSDESHGISIITAYSDLPKESQKIITLKQDQKSVCTTMSVDGGEDTFFNVDICDKKDFAETMHILANTRLKTETQVQEIPKTITFLEMFQAGRIEQLNPLRRWQDNNPVKSLATPVGVDADGSLFMLDLHEKRQGPHGLVAGMTGSGKSEFIITYILSMAVNYHPDEVAFVLIDYKGGGLTGAFENPQTGVRLPHLAGTITNLDGASIQRSLISIESELVRRQRIFNEVKSTVNEGTMDIYAYQKLYRAGRVSEPMPHLFIISDEFAELKQQQPEFMDKLISTARIGRSLGVHLILATQKPSGVVNDQIRSNTKFRVCLRVQERADSIDMLKRPDAAELTDTGRFYLQVGYNEYFAMGQSAWCGAPYEPQDTAAIRRDDAIDFLETTGQVMATAKPKVQKTDSGLKQIVAVVKYLNDLAEAQKIKQRQLCLPELPPKLELNTLQASFPCENLASSCYGIIDDPENQNQHPFILDISRSHNILVAGDTGAGKTSFLRNVLLTTASRLTPEEFNFYILDYSSRQFKFFRKVPHCGAVLYEEDSEQLEAFFKLINEILSERKKLFLELEVDNFEDASRVVRLPLILVAIDNFSGFTNSRKGEALAYQMPSYLKECAGYGIKFIITCSKANEVSSRIRQAINDRICLHMKDRYDYADILNCKVDYVPGEIPGRGLCVYNAVPLEFQLGTYWANSNNCEQTVALKNAIADLCELNEGVCEARHLPVLDENADYKDFSQQFGRGRIPLGFAKSTGKAVALPLKQFTTLSVYFGNPQGKKPILENILYTAAREKMEVWIVRQSMGSLFETPEAMFDVALLKDAEYLSSQPKDTRILQKALASVMTERKEILEKSQVNLELMEVTSPAYSDMCAQTKPIMVLIEDVAEFVLGLDPILTFSFNTLLEKAHLRNIYVVACLEPKSAAEIEKSEIFSLLAKRHVLLFGGQYDKQTLCSMPAEPGLSKQLSFNVGMMYYNKQLNPIVMPCGVIEELDKDEDMDSIF